MSPQPPSFLASFGTHLNANWYELRRNFTIMIFPLDSALPLPVADFRELTLLRQLRDLLYGSCGFVQGAEPFLCALKVWEGLRVFMA